VTSSWSFILQPPSLYLHTTFR